MLTGTWQEETDLDGYYRGATYHGAIQLTIGPSGHRMKGQLAGFGKDGEVNSGTWTLDLVSSDTGASAIEKLTKPTECMTRLPMVAAIVTSRLGVLVARRHDGECAPEPQRVTVSDVHAGSLLRGTRS